MRRTSAVALLALVGVLAAPVFAQEAAKWEIDRAHSAAHFAVRHYAVTTVRGTFTNITGTILIDDKNLANSSVDVTIDANTVNTQNENRDKHLRSADFFEVEKYPTITFKSKKVEPAGPGRAKVTGDLTIRGVTKEVVLDVADVTPAIKDPFGKTRAGARATQDLAPLRDFYKLLGSRVDPLQAE